MKEDVPRHLRLSLPNIAVRIKLFHKKTACFGDYLKPGENHNHITVRGEIPCGGKDDS